MQLFDEVEGIATAHCHTFGLIDSLDGVGIVVDAVELDAELGIDFLHFFLVGVVGGFKSAVGKAHPGEGDEKHALHLVALAEVCNHIFAPAEVAFASHGGVAYQKEVLFHCK